MQAESSIDGAVQELNVPVDVPDTYDRMASVYDWLFGFPLQPGRIAAARSLSLKPGDVVLEVGVGTALNAPLLSDKIVLVDVLGTVVAGTTLPVPAWLPDLEVLSLRHESDLRAWLGQQGIDVSANELARCGDGDCYVLGTRQSLAQLWVEKTPMEVRRIVLPGRGQTDLEEWASFDKLRFPGRIELSGGGGSATLAVQSVAAAPKLASADFTEAWVRAAPPAAGR